MLPRSALAKRISVIVKYEDYSVVISDMPWRPTETEDTFADQIERRLVEMAGIRHADGRTSPAWAILDPKGNLRPGTRILKTATYWEVIDV